MNCVIIITSKDFLIAGFIETKCSRFSACVAKDLELNSFNSCTVLLLTVEPLEMICIGNSI